MIRLEIKTLGGAGAPPAPPLDPPLTVIALVQLIYRKQAQKEKDAFEPPIVEEQYERVSYHALSNGTNGFS